MNNILYSILILSIPSRLQNLINLYSFLEKQSKDLPVEILTLVDNKVMSIGEKRNKILSCSSGKYISFLDDDDTVSEDFVKTIVESIQKNENKDVYCFKQECNVNGTRFYVDFDLKNQNDIISTQNPKKDFLYKRKPYHMCVWRSLLAKTTPFPNISYGEDLVWINNMSIKCRTQHKIDKILHYYNYSDSTSESIKLR